ncbi:DUF956 family protein [Leptotrichia buccalis]|uniref:Regulator of the mannose operon, ManO n=1 Tax=Leptotrichia buccalis (strain ATCC 14201 / DSM 1135 / JCM 12969 / NCTC 10249 / C-1013-b) TaxID=523794 RepID=C7NEK4_LEPBD|nr:DUF956 family protein [Leptotrichia buccalis]ACV38365.1 hypothetical protein Lebu_0454 [Leptotrichia buccalis C-1013-b]
MAISMNTKVLYTTKANTLNGMFGNKNGNILVGNNAFEFYNSRNPEDYIQIPWNEIIRVRAQLFFKDKYIRGFFIDTKNAGTYNFVVKNAGKTLKIMRDFLGNEKIVRNKPLLSMKNIFNLFKKNK